MTNPHPITLEEKTRIFEEMYKDRIPKHVPTTNVTSFDTGAVRSSDKQGVQYHLISPIGLRRIAETHAEGTAKYGYFNWEKGFPIGDVLNHAIAHIYTYLSGEVTNEDDLAHAAWNLLAAMHLEETHPHLDHQLRPNHPLTLQAAHYQRGTDHP